MYKGKPQHVIYEETTKKKIQTQIERLNVLIPRIF